MNSSISPFKPWLWALLTLAAIELTYYGVMRPPRITWNSFLDLSFAEAESFQRLVTHDKIIAFENADPDIIQVGDSSGLHGVQPPIVMSYIPGWNYLNMSVATNLGYSGYYNMARLQLERSPNARYLILYVSPMGGVPRRILWDDDQKLMAPQIYNEFMSPLHHLVQLPTLSARKDAINYGYYLGYRFKQRNEPISMNRGYLAFDAIFRESNGWTRETDVEGDVKANIFKIFFPGIKAGEHMDSEAIRNALRKFPKVTDEKFYNWSTLSYESYFDHIYDRFAELAKKHDVKLVLVFNPVPQSAGHYEFSEFIDWQAIRAGLSRLRSMHPEVILTDIDFWPDDKFSVFSHIGTQFSHESSDRVGLIMKKIIGDEKPVKRERPPQVPSSAIRVTIDFSRPYCGYGWINQAGTTNAFPMQQIGERNKGWIYMAVRPGADYTVRAVFQADDPTFTEGMQLKVNEEKMRKISSGNHSEDLYVEWQLPASVVNTYSGWLTLEFDLGKIAETDASGKHKILFRRLTLNPS